MLKLMPFLLFIVSCAHFHSGSDERAYQVQRSLASSSTGASCSGMLADLSLRERTFGETAFDTRFGELGSGYVSSVLEETVRGGRLTRDQAEMVDLLAQRLRTHDSTATALSDLAIDEKYLIWNVVIRPQMVEVEEVVLRNLASDGDEGAAFLLRVPAGEMRENATSAISLMRRAEPETSMSDIIRRIEARMSVCVR